MVAGCFGACCNACQSPGCLRNAHECLHGTLLSDQSELQPETEVAIAGWIFAPCSCVQACHDVTRQCKQAGIDIADGLSTVHCVLFVRRSDKSVGPLSSDSLLPLFIVAIIVAQPLHLHACLAYVRTFHKHADWAGQTGFQVPM